MGPTGGAQPRAPVEAADGDDEEGVGAGAVLIQVGALRRPVDVAELKDLGEPGKAGGEASAPQTHHNPCRDPGTPGDITQASVPHMVSGPSG